MLEGVSDRKWNSCVGSRLLLLNFCGLLVLGLCHLLNSLTFCRIIMSNLRLLLRVVLNLFKSVIFLLLLLVLSCPHVVLVGSVNSHSMVLCIELDTKFSLLGKGIINILDVASILFIQVHILESLVLLSASEVLWQSLLLQVGSISTST